MTVADTHRAILAVWRTEQQRLVAILARMLRDVPLAEELAQYLCDQHTSFFSQGALCKFA